MIFPYFALRFILLRTLAFLFDAIFDSSPFLFSIPLFLSERVTRRTKLKKEPLPREKVATLCVLQVNKFDEQKPRESVVGHNADQVGDGCDQGTGSRCRVNVDVLEENRNRRTDQTRNQHCDNQGYTDAARDCERIVNRHALENGDIETYADKGEETQNDAVQSTDIDFLGEKL